MKKSETSKYTIDNVNGTFDEHTTFGTVAEFNCPRCHQRLTYFEYALRSHHMKCECGIWNVDITFVLTKKDVHDEEE